MKKQIKLTVAEAILGVSLSVGISVAVLVLTVDIAFSIIAWKWVVFPSIVWRFLIVGSTMAAFLGLIANLDEAEEMRRGLEEDLNNMDK